MKVIFLYILKFKNENLIKIGIAEKNSRIISHMRTYSDYGIDLVESYKVTAKNVDDIRLLEKQLLRDYSNFFITNERLNGRDGYTEIRDAKILNNVIEDIEYKIKRLPDKDFKIKKGIKIKQQVNNNKCLPYTKRDWVNNNEIYQEENKKEIARYIHILNKYKIKLHNVEEDCGNIEFTFKNLTKDEYKEIRDNYFIGFEFETAKGYGGVNCGWGEGFPNDNKYIMGLQLNFSKEWDVVKPFRNEILRFIDNVKIIDKAS